MIAEAPSEFVKAAVIGHPIKHSKSPIIHNYWIKKYGLAGAYETADIPPDNLRRGLMGLVTRGFTGFNLTLPHKELVLDMCDEVDDLARRVGAVNTITVRDGLFFGTNTDVFGFAENIRDHVPDFNYEAGPIAVLGAGGAGRAAVHALLDQGCPKIRLSNRSFDKAMTLAARSVDSARVQVIPWEERGAHLADVKMLVNTTSLGMPGRPDIEINLRQLNPTACVYDIVYTPLYTKLLRDAQETGNPVITGIGMLLHQARPAFQSWFGVMPELDKELQEMVLS